MFSVSADFSIGVVKPCPSFGKRLKLKGNLNIHTKSLTGTRIERSRMANKNLNIPFFSYRG
jgi:hypothetical protein